MVGKSREGKERRKKREEEEKRGKKKAERRQKEAERAQKWSKIGPAERIKVGLQIGNGAVDVQWGVGQERGRTDGEWMRWTICGEN